MAALSDQMAAVQQPTRHAEGLVKDMLTICRDYNLGHEKSQASQTARVSGDGFVTQVTACSLRS